MATFLLTFERGWKEEKVLPRVEMEARRGSLWENETEY